MNIGVLLLLVLASGVSTAQTSTSPDGPASTWQEENALLREALEAKYLEASELREAVADLEDALEQKDAALAARGREIEALHRKIGLLEHKVTLYDQQLAASEKLADDFEDLWRVQLAKKKPSNVELWLWRGATVVLTGVVVKQSFDKPQVTVVNGAQ